MGHEQRIRISERSVAFRLPEQLAAWLDRVAAEQTRGNRSALLRLLLQNTVKGAEDQ